jgi:hypothetical protein
MLSRKGNSLACSTFNFTKLYPLPDKVDLYSSRNSFNRSNTLRFRSTTCKCECKCQEDEEPRLIEIPEMFVGFLVVSVLTGSVVYIYYEIFTTLFKKY